MYNQPLPLLSILYALVLLLLTLLILLKLFVILRACKLIARILEPFFHIFFFLQVK